MPAGFEAKLVRSAARVGLTFRNPVVAASRLQDPFHQERLEYVGDKFLALAIVDALVDAYPRLPGGAIGTLVPRYVSNENLNRQSRRLGISGLGLKRLTETDSKRDADTLEMFIGALLEDRGFSETHSFVASHLAPRDDAAARAAVATAQPKKDLYRLLKSRDTKAIYALRKEKTGRSEKPVFVASVSASIDSGNVVLGEGTSMTAKGAEQQAAQAALFAYYLRSSPTMDNFDARPKPVHELRLRSEKR